MDMNKEMSVLLVTMEGKGGIFQYTTQLANGLADLVQVSAMVPVNADVELFDDEVRIFRTSVGENRWNAAKNLFRLPWINTILDIVETEDPDIVHFQNAYNLWIASFLPRLSARNIFTTFHDVKPHLGYDRMDKRFARGIHLRYSNGFIVHCEKERRKLAQEVTGEDCYVIPHGGYSFYTKYDVQGVSEEDAVLYFGTLAPYKGLEYLLHAASTIEERSPSTDLLIAGQGDLERYESQISSLGNIEIHNRFISKPAVARLFERAKVIALPYIEATQSGVIPIAYAFKKPVVTTNVGCLPDVVDHGETGFLVQPENESELGSRIMELLENDELRAEMGEKAHRKMKRELSWDTIAERTVRAYTEAIDD